MLYLQLSISNCSFQKTANLLPVRGHCQELVEKKTEEELVNLGLDMENSRGGGERVIGPIPWGHSGPLCHALSLSWTSMRRWHATVPLATHG